MRCSSENEGRSASAVASRIDRGSETPTGATKLGRSSSSRSTRADSETPQRLRSRRTGSACEANVDHIVRLSAALARHAPVAAHAAGGVICDDPAAGYPGALRIA